jgi:ribosome biogenesis GTPase / thiamine phosphate phosphatase
MRAKVYKSTGSWYIVKTPDGTVFNARIIGVMKMDAITTTNPIAVGDDVEIETENEAEQSVMITKIYDRNNYVIRTSPHNKYQNHIVAANLDQSVLFATLKEPRTSQGFIDRFLATCEAYHIPAVIVLNKADVYRKKEMEQYAAWKEMYEAVGYRLLLMSVQQNEGVEELKNLLKDKITLLSGHSGVGKSSFINSIFPELALKTQQISGWSGKGMHTTTFAEMHDLPFGGRVIDTPGIKELGLVNMEQQELSHYFPEMRALIGQCQFNNCLHLEEPGCAVKDAVRENKIHPNRYISYCTILASLGEKLY